MLTTTLPILLLAAARVSAIGCSTHTYGTCEDNIVHWYDPDDGQICDPLDCGGGRAPVKYNVPCCAAYTGTEACVTAPSYMPCFAKSTSAVEVSESTEVSVTTTEVIASPTEATVTSATATASQTSAVGVTTGSQSSSSVVSTTAPPIIGSTSQPVLSSNGTLAPTSSAPGNISTSGTPAPASTNAAYTVRYDSMVAVAGMLLGNLVAMV